MSLDVEYEVEEPDGTIREFGTMKEALDWCEEHHPEGGCTVRRRVLNPKEEL